ncbi:MULTISPECIES: aminodeoxychorismate lyase [Pseudomonas]|uniref:aminodeoxychorismate lyase n=1 Tax=Pseudomonas TaxID=286 RepID=UPI0007B34F4F|nr:MULTISPECIES: aminodeoxychorismate lyase [Pseudomonas]AZC49433.1 Aminodeoxychorismate lyase [Pseudomonas chlororaphis subsp. piscium]AZC56060.1 Aminodeoxychorismate lyase [Pseudomonas chlororaphis subsp. piscium]AZC62319.1 Aminodeoxychorismate lyase [Pseudomonas chlororaphis subsp. piscium]AZC68557.1 Aminodeoxychorismate lyase [Pseudomonas chlororaphis subsp. piscium]AZC74746.1 Aminodeoxychorismate lyase [Pseudomonas chlororaphis subsp. piscium]
MDSWVDGQPADVLSLKDRGLAYGDGLFETIAVKAGQPLLLERHLLRLAEGCSRLAIAADQALIRSELTAYASLLGEGVLKLILTRGDSQRGYAADPRAQPRRILQGNAPAVYPAVNAEQGIRLFPCTTRLSEQPLLAGLKHLNRLEQVLARSEWQDSEHAEGLMLDLSGRVIEGVFSNLFLVRDGALFTADLSRCGVAGVMRAEILFQAASLGIPAEIADISLEQLQQADEVFACNSVYGIWPVLACGALRWSAGPLTRKLQRIARTLLDA